MERVNNICSGSYACLRSTKPAKYSDPHITILEGFGYSATTLAASSKLWALEDLIPNFLQLLKSQEL